MSADLLPPGHVLVRGALAHLALQDVVDGLTWDQRTIALYGKTHPVPRLTTWYGTGTYTYSGIRNAPRAWTSHLDRIRDAVRAITGAYTGESPAFDSMLGNLYRGGSDSVAWHSDDERELGPAPTIASVSLGASRVFKIRSKVDHERRDWTVELAHGDVLVMHGRSQADYEHSIPKTARAVGTRVNLTFRQVVA